jgi:hypothetical protein
MGGILGPSSNVTFEVTPGSPTSAACEQTLGTLVTRTPVNTAGVPYVTTAREKFRDAFLTFDTTNNWTQESTGSGQTITLGGVANSSRYLNIASGTTANAETSIISKIFFRTPCTVLVAASLSQRIANQDFFIEMVEIDDKTGQVITDTTQPSTRFKNARNGASFQFTGTTATTQTVNVRQDGLTEQTATGTYTTTAATGSNPNFIPAGIFEITLRSRDVQFSSVAVDAAAAKTIPLIRNSRVPNPDAVYALRIRCLNGATPPASSTDFRIHAVTILDDTRVSVDMGSISGVSNITNSLPVQVSNSVTISGTVTTNSALTASTARGGFLAASGIWYDDTVTPLTANSTFTGTSRDCTVTATATTFANASTFAKEVRLSAEADVTGTLWLEVSRDATNWRRVKSVATTAVTGGGFYSEIVHRPSWRYFRVGFTNGAGAQARLTVNSLLVAI